MGKRKQPSDHHQSSPHSSDIKPCSSRMELLPKEHHPSLGRSMFFKRSHHHYAHQYTRRNSGNHANTSTSRGKGVPIRDDKVSYKVTSSPCNSESRRPSEIREKPFSRPARIRSSFLATDAVSADPGKMICGVCQKLLRRKPLILGVTLSSTEVSVVAVLVCGHVYHADCLEQKTNFEDRRDPPCPLCVGILPRVEDSREQTVWSRKQVAKIGATHHVHCAPPKFTVRDGWSSL